MFYRASFFNYKCKKKKKKSILKCPKGPHPGRFRAGQGLSRTEFVPGVEASQGSCGHCPSDGSWQALKAQFPTSFLTFHFTIKWASPVAQMVKNPSAMRETRVGSLGQEDPLEKDMATHSSIPAWRIPWTEEPGGPQSTGPQSQIGLRGRQTHPASQRGLGTWEGRPTEGGPALCPRKGDTSSLF